MSLKPFQFKEFTINQDKTAMKVGTDGVLLGAWIDLNPDPESILDIGAGTGLIALQMAQRSNCMTIDAVEIEPNAYEQTVENFENSGWGDRLFCYHASLQEFTEEIDEKYDLIISNPPFYNSTFKEIENKRAIARHTKSLTFEELLKCTSKLLTPTGSCAFIIPYMEETDFLNLARQNNLFPKKITRVKGNINSEIKRSLIHLSFSTSQTEIDEISIEIKRHEFTDKYSDLVKEFYINM